MAARGLLGAVLALAAASVHADWQWQYGGYLQGATQLQQYHRQDLRADDGERRAREDTAALRMELNGRSSAMQLKLRYELLGERGEAVENRDSLTDRGRTLFEPSRIIPEDETRLMRLRHSVTEGNQHRVVQRLDRASVSTGTLTFSAAIGRQVHNWGNGRVFQVHDWLNPGSPLAMERDYRSGEDMLYGEYLTSDGGELQMAAVARREQATGDVTHDAATYAVKREWMTPDLEFRLLAARHYGQASAGFGVAGDWKGAVWRLDGVVDRTRDGRTRASAVANMDRFWSCAARTCYGFVEYYRNGLGVGDGDYNELNESLAWRLDNKDLFSLGRDYGAVGLGVEWFDHLDARLESLSNLNDGSTFNRLWLEYEPRQNLSVSGGLGVSSGGRDDEFSGVPLGQGDGGQGYSENLFLRVAAAF